MAVTAPAISFTEGKESAVRVLHQWLLEWFDGETHDVGAAEDVSFPDLSEAGRIRFDQGEIGGDVTAPLNGAELRLAILDGRSRRYQALADSDGGIATGQQRHDEVILQFNVRVRSGTLPEANLLADRITDRLRALLITPPCHADLLHRGIRRLRPGRAVALNDTQFARRQMLCAVRLEYDVPYARD